MPPASVSLTVFCCLIRLNSPRALWPSSTPPVPRFGPPGPSPCPSLGYGPQGSLAPLTLTPPGLWLQTQQLDPKFSPASPAPSGLRCSCQASCSFSSASAGLWAPSAVARSLCLQPQFLDASAAQLWHCSSALAVGQLGCPHLLLVSP